MENFHENKINITNCKTLGLKLRIRNLLSKDFDEKKISLTINSEKSLL